jgi:hypothetical protein
LGVQAQTQRGVASLLGQHLVKTGLLPPSVSRDFALLTGLRAQADYNRHFQLAAADLAEELARVEALFTLVEGFLADRGITPPAV